MTWDHPTPDEWDDLSRDVDDFLELAEHRKDLA